jgi:hypothetical protein
MSKPRFDFASPSVFNCHRIAFERVEYANSTWYSIKVYGDGEHANHGREIATIHRDTLPDIIYDHGDGPHTLWISDLNNPPLTPDPALCQTSNS